MHTFNKSPWLLPISLCCLAICASGLPWPYSGLCGTHYWPNTKVRSRNRLHVGGSALAPCPTAHRVQGCLLGVAVPVKHCSNLPNWSVSGIASGRSLCSTGRGVLSVPFARASLMQVRAFCVNGPSVWNGLPLEFTSYVGRFPTHSIVILKLFFLTVLESGEPLRLEKAL